MTYSDIKVDTCEPKLLHPFWILVQGLLCTAGSTWAEFTAAVCGDFFLGVAFLQIGIVCSHIMLIYIYIYTYNIIWYVCWYDLKMYNMIIWSSYTCFLLYCLNMSHGQPLDWLISKNQGRRVPQVATGYHLVPLRQNQMVKEGRCPKHVSKQGSFSICKYN